MGCGRRGGAFADGGVSAYVLDVVARPETPWSTGPITLGARCEPDPNNTGPQVALAAAELFSAPVLLAP